MNWDWTLWLTWLVRTALGGGLFLLFVWGLAKAIRQPVRRQRLAEAGVVAALALGVLSLTPSWLVVPLPVTFEPVAASPAPPQRSSTFNDLGTDATERRVSAPGAMAGHVFLLPGTPAVDVGSSAAMALDESGVEDAPAANAPSSSPASSAAVSLRTFSREEFAFWLAAVYLAGVAFNASRWLLGYIGLRRLLRTSLAPPAPVAQLFAAMTRGLPGRPCLRMSHRLRGPVSCGLFHPTVVLPANLCESGRPSTLRWVFAHELTHLRRGDAWSGLLFALGGVVFFFCPWFWWLRRQVRLCQEYVADAVAVDQDARTADYAQFLLSLAAVPPGPVLAIGTVGASSDLFRRITMLLHAPLRVEKHCPRLWALTIAAGLLAIAVLASGLGLQAADPAPGAPDQPRQAQAEPAKKAESTEVDEIVATATASLDEPTGTPPEAIDALQKALDNLPKGPEMEKVREELRKAIDRLKEIRTTVPPVAVGRLAPGQAPRFQSRLMQRGRLGARVEPPSAALADQLDLPKGKGMVIDQVVTDSAAAKAGLKANDILLELNGQAVPSDAQEFIRMVHEIKANTPVDAVVLRKGKKETVKGLSLPEEAALPATPFGGRPAPVPRVPGAPGILPVPAAPPAPVIQGLPPGPGARPVVPGVPRPGLPAITAGVGFAVPNGVTISLFRSNDSFTTRQQEGNLVITVTGTVTAGKGKASEIKVQDGTETNDYKSVDKVPERYREKVKNLIEMSEKGQVKVETKDR
jgi:beta-lactamase regulating signal transducer with metallopeptidase domain